MHRIAGSAPDGTAGAGEEDERMYGTVAWPLIHTAQLQPDREAVVDGDIRRTYAELHDRVARLGSGLDSQGIGRGAVVSVLAHNSAAHLEAWLGLPAHGRVINDLNVRLASAELAFMVDDCQAVALIVDDAHLKAGRELLEQCESLRLLIYAGREESPAEIVSWETLVSDDPQPFPDVAEDSLAAIVYTGGTSGRPKGVMLSHRNLLANAKQYIIAITHRPEDRYLHVLPMFHVADTSQTYALTWVGGTHVMLPAFKPDAVARMIEEERITLLQLVPTTIAMLLDDPDTTKRDLSSLRLLFYAASPMPAELQRRAMDVLKCDFAQMYGMTEAAPLVTQCTPEDHRRGAAGEEPYASRLPSAGAAVIGVQVQVRNAQTGDPVPEGEAGEIWVRGPNVMQGYWNLPEETAAAITEDGWYRTGDVAYQDDRGYLFIVDRVKDMIVSGGENIYSTEVELAIYEHPDVAEVAVFGAPDEKWGERVHAVVVPRDGAQVDEEAIVKHARSRIAGYKVPRSIDIRTEPLPKSAAGKILKRELREPMWEGRKEKVS
jgi:long-chain acyl-CoA synthetase